MDHQRKILYTSGAKVTNKNESAVVFRAIMQSALTQASKYNNPTYVAVNASLPLLLLGRAEQQTAQKYKQP